ncbi:hypothetical protein RF11_05102 [Thelohanellus kitauei]|uniref:Uncharacterized protein n=1 Tax=Thelohanellus kitauei TaxID=669202 RepID=A0A0C2MA55_THEKT|nr:hypothetical protein RF11_05102 [Thelohanellus kitauei]
MFGQLDYIWLINEDEWVNPTMSVDLVAINTFAMILARKSKPIKARTTLLFVYHYANGRTIDPSHKLNNVLKKLESRNAHPIILLCRRLPTPLNIPLEDRPDEPASLIRISTFHLQGVMESIEQSSCLSSGYHEFRSFEEDHAHLQ